MKYLIVFFLVVVGSFQASAQQSAKPNNTYIAKTAKGHFEILVTFAAEGRGGRLYGTVTNKTGHDWSFVKFQIIPFDLAGNPFKVEDIVGLDFSIFKIKDGQTITIGSDNSFGAYISYSGSQQQASKLEFQVATGMSPVSYEVTMMKPVSSKGLQFEDGFIEVRWTADHRQLGFTLQNKTDNPIKIDWNQVSYVDPDGKAERVMHSGVKFTSRAESQPTTTIPPSAKIEDIVYPSSYAYYDNSRYSSGWKEKPLFPYSEGGLSFIGKSFSVFMPLEINGVVKNYNFSFKINDMKFLPLPADGITSSQPSSSTIKPTSTTTQNTETKPKTCYEGGRKVSCP